MRIKCPLCGDRDRREFYYMGSEDHMHRPPAGAPIEDWDNHLHLRDNPPGDRKDLWHHEAGCGAWLLVHRNTTTHEIYGAELAEKVKKP